MAWPADTKLIRATLLTVAGSICLDLDDSTTLAQFYDDAIDELGKLPNPPFIERGFQKVVSGTATYDHNAIEDGAGNTLSTLLRPLYIFYDDTLMYPESETSLQSYSEDWEADSGTPVAYTSDDVDASATDRLIQLYPKPDATGDAIAAVGWGSTFPDNDLTYFFSEGRETDIEDYYALPLIFDILSREFAYPSDHQDLEYSAICRLLADFLYKLVEVR